MKPYLQEDGLDLPTVLPRCILPSGGVQHLVCGDACIGQSFLSPDHPDDNVRHTVLRLVTWVDGKGSTASISLNAHGLAGWTRRAPLGKETLWAGVVWPTFPSLTAFRTTRGAHRAGTGCGGPKGTAGSRRGLHRPKALPACWAPTGILGNTASYLAHRLKKAINGSQRATNFIYLPNMKYPSSF